MKLLSNACLVLIVSTLSSVGSAAEILKPYYGSEFLTGYQSGKLRDQALVDALQKILSQGHLKNPNAPDTLIENCNSTPGQNQVGQNPIQNPIDQVPPKQDSNQGPVEQNPKSPKCVQHQALGYDRARTKLFGVMYLEQVGGVYAVKDVYCERTYTDKDFGGKLSIGPNLIPSDGSILNTEHTWPQSKFTGRFSKEMQKSDLHHLFPSDSKMNSSRGNLHFGNVVEEVEKLNCSIGRLGRQNSSKGEIVFEAPQNHRGNVARAIFYFATRYQMKMSPYEEAALRQWNEQDPVDEAEARHNDQIESYQGNRNPFVDFPDLINHIQHF